MTVDQGYVMVTMPDHPRANHHGYVKRSDLVMEALLGRHLLPGEIVHHDDENRQNDEPQNLVLTTSADHLRLHVARRKQARDRSKREIGSPAS